ncbi:M15 family metallopeptidase [Neobacillus sp. DY30]|uniref:M15 family metallopeptidase n=1 Tax=Neobacillus sp. DY30 TaxID=3047871 RepID=UPI0024C007F2|nr:M15 family metallopeptidase [Neobacillus sp. DY30]WHY02659.1 M15 family metallopeptidase [Neobacillus sp. DY30]
MKRVKLLLFLLAVGISTIFILKDKETMPSKATGMEPKKDVPLPTELHPVVKERSDQLVQQAAKIGIVVVITDGFRSIEEQNTIYEQGRTTEGNIVTNAKGGESYHNYGLAIDFALETPSGDVIWDRQYDRNQNGKSDWSEVVKIAKSLGFEWGGDWKGFKDYPHFQMDFGLKIADLQNGARPDESSAVADTQ